MVDAILHLKVDRADPMPLYEQVADAIRRAIINGEIVPGDRLPPAPYIASVLHVHANTVLRALRKLRAEDMLEFRRGEGVKVVGGPRRGAVLEKARELLQFARHSGYGSVELVEFIQTLH